MFSEELCRHLARRWSARYPTDGTVVLGSGPNAAAEFHVLVVDDGRLCSWTCSHQPPDGWCIDLSDGRLVETMTLTEDRPDLAAAATVSRWSMGARVEQRRLPPFDVDLPLMLAPVAGADIVLGFRLNGSPWGTAHFEVAVRGGQVEAVTPRAALASDLDLQLSYPSLCAYLAGRCDVYEMLEAGIDIDGELDDLELVIGMIEWDGARARYRDAISGVDHQVVTLAGLTADIEACSLARHDLADWSLRP